LLSGIVGAGVAGVILFAGLTFAALSLSKWSTSSKLLLLFLEELIGQY